MVAGEEDVFRLSMANIGSTIEPRSSSEPVDAQDFAAHTETDLSIPIRLREAGSWLADSSQPRAQPFVARPPADDAVCIAIAKSDAGAVRMGRALSTNQTNPLRVHRERKVIDERAAVRRACG
jgi:hypothetical protein